MLNKYIPKYSSIIAILCTFSVQSSFAVQTQYTPQETYGHMYDMCIKKFDGNQCANIAIYTFTERDEVVNGIQFLQRGCKLDNARSCLILGNIFREGKKACEDPYLAKRYYDKACRLGSSEACNLYNRYKIRKRYTSQSPSEIIDAMFKNKKRQKMSEQVRDCACKQTPAPKKECPDHIPPEG